MNNLTEEERKNPGELAGRHLGLDVDRRRRHGDRLVADVLRGIPASRPYRLGDTMHIDQLEKMGRHRLGHRRLFVAVILGSALFHGIHAPSNVETIDSAKLHLSEEFAEDKLGASTNPDGSVTVRMVAGRYGFIRKP